MFDKINIFWRENKIDMKKLDMTMVLSWEKEYDTHLDRTNLAQFIIDRYDDPIAYLKFLIDF